MWREQITICGVPHTIEYVDRSDDNNMGRWIEKKQKIQLDGTMEKGVLHHTLIHEMLNCMLHMQGDSKLGEDEDFINRLATSIVNSSFTVTTVKEL